MLSLFSCCCHRRQPSSDDVNTPDERSHLIPATSEDLISPTSLGLPRTYVDDNQRMKERMSDIVRAKEGKMVNVNARLPFNLHNQPSGSGSGSTHAAHPSSASSLSLSSSSRSPSAVRPAALAQTPGTPHTHAQVQVHVGAPLPAGPAAHAPHHHHHRDDAAAGDMSRSSSTASRDTGASEGSPARRRAAPILGLRLVRVPLPGGSVGRRGRRKRKAGGGGGAEEGVSPQGRRAAAVVSVGVVGAEGGMSVDVGAEALGTPRARRTSSHRDSGGAGAGAGHGREDANVSPPSMSSSEAEMTPRVEHPKAWAISVSPASEDSGREVGEGKGVDGAGAFVLKDEGPLTVSWGD
ncbi:hypothetical protein BJ912DRAFT_1040048 [Pholiota molesta]|nr:hypothetical protein BJ912DRAFT_1040048 [Pholiota molesta]